MTSFLSPTPALQYLPHTSPQLSTPQSVLQTLHRRGDDAGTDNIWPSTCTSHPGGPIPLCFPPHLLSPPATSSTLTISTTTRTVTHTATLSSSGNAAPTFTTTTGREPTSATEPALSSGLPVIVPDHRGLSTGELVGVIVGSISGAFLLLLFLWLLRRGTFGSGTLFGFRYGDARKAGWGGAGNEMRQKSREGYLCKASEPPPSDGSTLFAPSLPGTKLPSYSRVLSTSTLSLHKAPPLTPPSPPHWSTSSSAFDNAYPVSSTSAHTRSASASVSMSVSISDNSTLVSESSRLRPSGRNPTVANARDSPPTAFTFPNAHAYHGVSIPLPRRPPSPGETVSTSMVSFDQSAPGDFDVELSDVASLDSETRSEWEVDTAESSQPLGRGLRGNGSESDGAGG